ncbi:MAG: hypothetical protein JO165_09475 [Candidatus Eremiobacteraeota bacterium]|nr:hypothetical protein [Candidatus Eremiobacteraeota bacterium]
MNFRLLAAALLLGATGVNQANLHDSRLSFRAALQSCQGALGSVTFSLGHTRIAGADGVNMDQSEPDQHGLIHALLQNSNATKTAGFTIDPHRRAVFARNLRVERRGAIACIYPD